MFDYFISYAPVGVVNATCLLGLLFLGYIAAWFSSNYCSSLFSEDDRIHADSVLKITSGGFFFFLAFVIYTSWNSFINTRHLVLDEASTLATMIHEVNYLPKPAQSIFNQAVKNYVIAIRVDEWQSMRKGHLSPSATMALERLYTLKKKYRAAFNDHSVPLLNFTTQLDHLLVLRETRLDQLDSIVPDAMYHIIFTGIIGITLFAGFLSGKDDFMRLLGVLGLAMIFGLNLSLILNFYHIFSGGICISNAPFYQGPLANF